MHLGLDEKKKANEYFSLIVYTLIGIGVVLAPAISRLLGASEEMLPYCVLYLRIKRSNKILSGGCMNLKESLETINNSRIDRCKKHSLVDILMIVFFGAALRIQN